jgi:predicted ATPase
VLRLDLVDDFPPAPHLEEVGGLGAEVECVVRGERSLILARLPGEHARSQAARSFELRAATSCARWLREGRRAPEGRELLGVVCAWFPEHLATRDLDEAHAVLHSLATVA